MTSFPDFRVSMNRLGALGLAAGLLCTTAVAAAATSAPAAAPVPAVAATGQDAAGPLTSAALSLTVYQQGLALVRDERTVDLGLGAGELFLPGISAQIVPGSTVVDSQGLDVGAIHYVRANLTPAALLAGYVGRSVGLIRDGSQRVEPALLLGVEDDRPIVRIDGRVEIGGPDAPWRITLDELPADLSGRNGLRLELDNTVRGPQSLELVYLTRGVSWQADYVGVLDPQSQRLRLSGWASIANDTDVGFEQAQLQLLAGDINQTASPLRMYAMAESAARAKSDLPSAALFDYHIYSLPTPVTLTPGQRTQVSLLAPREVPVAREYRLSGAAFAQLSEPQLVSVEVSLKLENTPPALGRPLPAGIVRIYGEGEQGRLQLLGEDRIGHTATGEQLDLALGKAFDIRGERTQTSYRKVDQNTAEFGWRIALSNAKDVPVTVIVEEQLPGDWSLLESSRPPQQQDAHRLEWRVELPAGGSEAISYRAQRRF